MVHITTTGFLIFISDIDSGVVNNLLKFADDTKLVGIVSSEYEVQQLRSDLQRLYDWSLDWESCSIQKSENCYILVTITEMLKVLIMVTLCNRADHYIFALWFLSSIFFILA